MSTKCTSTVNPSFWYSSGKPTGKAILKEMLVRAARLPLEFQIPAIEAIVKDKDPEKAIDEFVEGAYSRTKLYDESVLKKTFLQPFLVRLF